MIPGYNLATIRTGRFFLDLFRATGEWNFLEDTLSAARFLESVSVPVGVDGLAFAFHDNGIAETAEAGALMYDLNSELLFDYFTPTVNAYASYLASEASDAPLETNWYGSPGLTQAAADFLSLLGESYET